MTMPVHTQVGSFRLEIAGNLRDLERIAFGIAGVGHPDDDGEDATHIASQDAQQIAYLRAENEELTASLKASQKIADEMTQAAEKSLADLADANKRMDTLGPDAERDIEGYRSLLRNLQDLGGRIGVKPGEHIFVGISKVFDAKNAEIEALKAEVKKVTGSGDKVLDARKATTAALRREVAASGADAAPQQPPPAPPPPPRPAPAQPPVATAIGKVAGPTSVSVNIGALTITTNMGSRDIPTKPLAKALNHMSGLGMFGRDKIRTIGGFVSDDAMMASLKSMKGALEDIGLSLYVDKINIGLRAMPAVGAA